MINFKKLPAVFLAALLSVSMTACQTPSQTEATLPSATEATVETELPTEAATQPPTEEATEATAAPLTDEEIAEEMAQSGDNRGAALYLAQRGMLRQAYSYFDLSKLVGAHGVHSAMLDTETGTVLSQGNGYYGQCEVEPMSDIVSLRVGFRHTAGLRSDGTVIALGVTDIPSAKPKTGPAFRNWNADGFLRWV